MDRGTKSQLELFPDNLPNWGAVPPERQHDLRQSLSQLLELALQWPSLQHIQPQDQENHHV